MTDISSLDPVTLATQMAGYDVQAAKAAWTAQQSSLTTQTSNLAKLKAALTAFQTSLTSLNSSTQGMLANSATVSQPTAATVTATSQANRGTYNLTISQLASAQQTAYSSLTDEMMKNASGSLSLTVQGKSINVDLSSLNSLGDFADAINNSADNPGVTASLVRTDGKVQLMLSSDKSGVANAIQLDSSKLDSQTAQAFNLGTEISAAKDAKVSIGSLELTSSSNKLDSLIEGVTINLQAVTPADSPLILTIGTDTTGTQKNVQTFVDAYNTLKTTLDSQNKAMGSNKALASSLTTELNSQLRTSINGLDMTRFGLTTDRDGKLTLNNDTLNKQLTSSPQSVNDFFTNKGLFTQLGKSLNNYLGSGQGIIQSQQSVLDRQQADLTDRQDKITTRYNNAYGRYLSQYTRLKNVMQEMNNTLSSLFSS